MLQRLPVHVQNLSRARHVSLRVLETARDVAAFKFSAVLTKVSREWNSQTAFGI